MYVFMYKYIYILYIYLRTEDSSCLRAHQHGSDKTKILNDQSANYH